MSGIDLRLKKQKDFNLVFKKGQKLFCKDFTMLFIPTKELKVGYAVSKKHGKSVKRNRIKRLFRESFRSFVPKLKKEFFFVFIPKVKDTDFSLEEIKKSMNTLFTKGGFFIV